MDHGIGLRRYKQWILVLLGVWNVLLKIYSEFGILSIFGAIKVLNKLWPCEFSQFPLCIEFSRLVDLIFN